MTIKVKVERQSPRGRAHGPRVEIMLRGENGWNGHYQIDGRGLSDEEIVERRDRILEHHRQKAARMTRFMKPEFRRARWSEQTFVEGREVPGAPFELRDCLIRERGTDVELFVRLRDTRKRRVEFTVIRPTVEELPSDAEIEALIRVAIAEHVERHAAEEAARVRVAAALGATIGEDSGGPPPP
jgi:hypothetical protein